MQGSTVRTDALEVTPSQKPVRGTRLFFVKYDPSGVSETSHYKPRKCRNT